MLYGNDEIKCLMLSIITITTRHTLITLQVPLLPFRLGPPRADDDGVGHRDGAERGRGLLVRLQPHAVLLHRRGAALHSHRRQLPIPPQHRKGARHQAKERQLQRGGQSQVSVLFLIFHRGKEILQ